MCAVAGYCRNGMCIANLFAAKFVNLGACPILESSPCEERVLFEGGCYSAADFNQDPYYVPVYAACDRDFDGNIKVCNENGKYVSFSCKKMSPLFFEYTKLYILNEFMKYKYM